MPTEELIDQSFESIPAQEKPPKREKFLTLGKFKIKLKTVYISAGGFFGLLALLAILVSSQQPSKITEVKPLPTLTPTPTEEVISRPSAYATDSAILKVEGELEVLEEKIQTTDIKETGLNPPLLDMEVDFKD